ncbi:hypothetical protein [Streptosporangium canum]
MAAGCRALLEASLEPAVRKLTLVEAPGALDWSTMRNIQAGCKEQMRRGLVIAIEAGCIPDRPLEPLTSLLYGGICEIALDLADAIDQHAALEDSSVLLPDDRRPRRPRRPPHGNPAARRHQRSVPRGRG